MVNCRLSPVRKLSAHFQLHDWQTIELEIYRSLTRTRAHYPLADDHVICCCVRRAFISVNTVGIRYYDGM